MKKTIVTLALMGTTLLACESSGLRVINDESMGVRNYSKDRIVSYIDKIPYNTLDLVVDYSSGKRIERDPSDKDIIEFKKLEAEAKTYGLIE